MKPRDKVQVVEEDSSSEDENDGEKPSVSGLNSSTENADDGQESFDELDSDEALKMESVDFSGDESEEEEEEEEEDDEEEENEDDEKPLNDKKKRVKPLLSNDSTDSKRSKSNDDSTLKTSTISNGKAPAAGGKISSSSSNGKGNKSDDDYDSTDIESDSEPEDAYVTKAEKRANLKKIRERDNLARKRPDAATDRETERALQRLSTRGVVQLFNAVREHQTKVKQSVKKAGKTLRKKDNARAKAGLDKAGFMESLNDKKKKPATWSALSEEGSALPGAEKLVKNGKYRFKHDDENDALKEEDQGDGTDDDRGLEMSD